MPFLSIQNNTPVTDKLVFTIQHEKYTQNPAQLQLFEAEDTCDMNYINTNSYFFVQNRGMCAIETGRVGELQ